VEGLGVSFWAGKRVLLTGHTGFKGSWMSLWLLSLGARLTGYARAPDGEPALFEQLGLSADFDSRIGDIRDAEAFERVVLETRPDIVFHFAAQPLVLASYEDPAGTFATNVMGTVNLLSALRKADGDCAAVFITTDKVYENLNWEQRYRETDGLGGHDPYSASKAASELAIASWRRSFLAAAGVRIASARAGNVIGAGDWAPHRIVPDLARALFAKKPLAVRNPRAIRPWQHVLEPLRGYLLLAERLSDPANRGLEDCFNFGPAAEADRTVRDLVEHALAAWPGKTYGWRDVSDAAAPHEANFLSLSIDRARARLGWTPRWDFSRTVSETMSGYYSSYGESPRKLRRLLLETIGRYEPASREPALVRPAAAE
jgi:CDP-glucose 4,6-dehydratase